MSSIAGYLKAHPNTARLGGMLLAVFIAPCVVFSALTLSAEKTLSESIAGEVTKFSEEVAMTTDRNLFERYGDVQAFGFNRANWDKNAWYKSEGSPIVDAMNDYMRAYGMYYLMIFVDLQGKVVAINSKDDQGRPIDTAELWNKNYSGSAWFRALKEQQYTTKRTWTESGNDTLTGTFIEDVGIDPDVRAAYRGADARTLGFSAPVMGPDGKPIGYWTNRFKFSVVESILVASAKAFADTGAEDNELIITSLDGTILSSAKTVASEVKLDPEALGKSNLTAISPQLAKVLNVEHEGYLQDPDALSGAGAGFGYHHLVGALGFPGMDWVVVSSAPDAHLYEDVHEIERRMYTGLACLLAAFLPISFFLLRGSSRREEAAAEARAKEEAQRAQISRINSIVENSPNATMLCDKDNDFKISYMNPATRKLLTKLQDHLPVSVDKIIGSSIDIFHKNASHQRRLLADPRNLPHTARIKLGKETISLNIYALYDGDTYLGPALAWDLITERAELEARDEKAKQAVAVVRQALEKVASGDMDAIISEDFGAEMNSMRDNVNRIATVLTQFNTELSDLSAAARAGELDRRADASQFSGAYADVITQVNDVLDSVLEPVRRIREQLGRIAQGDLTAYVREDYVGEHAALRDALNRSLDGLNELLGQVSAATNQISTSSGQVAAAAQDLSQGASEQAATVEEISAQMAQITSQTQQNADHATQANQLAIAARDGARTGDTRMSEMLGAMREIEDASNNISKIIKVIDEIAFQTNLLALNAAVEAARAGAHGKGFAVVAEEVRNLAARSARAAKETTEMIEGSIKKVALGTGIAKETATALASIVQDVGKVSDLVAEIAAASTEQAEGINQINTGLEQVNQVTQRNTATAEESAASAEEMNGQTAEMQRMVARFTLTQERASKFRLEDMPQELLAELQRHLGRMGSQPSNDARPQPAVKRAVAAGGANVPRPASAVIALDSNEFGRY